MIGGATAMSYAQIMSPLLTGEGALPSIRNIDVSCTTATDDGDAGSATERALLQALASRSSSSNRKIEFLDLGAGKVSLSAESARQFRALCPKLDLSSALSPELSATKEIYEEFVALPQVKYFDTDAFRVDRWEPVEQAGKMTSLVRLRSHRHSNWVVGDFQGFSSLTNLDIQAARKRHVPLTHLPPLLKFLDYSSGLRSDLSLEEVTRDLRMLYDNLPFHSPHLLSVSISHPCLPLPIQVRTLLQSLPLLQRLNLHHVFFPCKPCAEVLPFPISHPSLTELPIVASPNLETFYAYLPKLDSVCLELVRDGHGRDLNLFHRFPNAHSFNVDSSYDNQATPIHKLLGSYGDRVKSLRILCPMDRSSLHGVFGAFKFLIKLGLHDTLLDTEDIKTVFNEFPLLQEFSLVDGKSLEGDFDSVSHPNLARLSIDCRGSSGAADPMTRVSLALSGARLPNLRSCSIVGISVTIAIENALYLRDLDLWDAEEGAEVSIENCPSLASLSLHNCLARKIHLVSGDETRPSRLRSVTLSSCGISSLLAAGGSSSCSTMESGVEHRGPLYISPLQHPELKIFGAGSEPGAGEILLMTYRP